MSKFKTIKVKLKTIDKELDEIYRLLDTAQLTEVEIKEIQAMMVKELDNFLTTKGIELGAFGKQVSQFEKIKTTFNRIDKELDELHRLLDTAQLTEVEIKEIQAMMVKVMTPLSKR